ncbi:MAG TPA: zinc ribbon domain-containing protein [Gemmataceae bacterium]|nr:zinc ribbon domain-containing protein [Gemmataceae bacterium]
MPTYEYVCDACEHAFEEFQSFSDEVLIKCPKCGKKKLRRLFGSGAAILFKGSGFYETDYRSDSYKSAAKKEQESAKPAVDGAATDGKGGKSDTGGQSGTAKTEGGGKSSGKSAKSKGRVSDD